MSFLGIGPRWTFVQTKLHLHATSAEQPACVIHVSPVCKPTRVTISLQKNRHSEELSSDWHRHKCGVCVVTCVPHEGKQTRAARLYLLATSVRLCTPKDGNMSPAGSALRGIFLRPVHMLLSQQHSLFTPQPTVQIVAKVFLSSATSSRASVFSRRHLQTCCHATSNPRPFLKPLLAIYL